MKRSMGTLRYILGICFILSSGVIFSQGNIPITNLVWPQDTSGLYLGTVKGTKKPVWMKVKSDSLYINGQWYYSGDTVTIGFTEVDGVIGNEYGDLSKLDYTITYKSCPTCPAQEITDSDNQQIYPLAPTFDTTAMELPYPTGGARYDLTRSTLGISFPFTIPFEGKSWVEKTSDTCFTLYHIPIYKSEGFLTEGTMATYYHDTSSYEICFGIPSASSSNDTIFNSYTALRAYTGGANSVSVRDFTYTHAGDIYTTFGGRFYRVTSGTENGGTIIVASNGTIWQRDWDGINIVPEWWEGTNENGRLQNAVDFCSGINGGKINLLSNKTYELNRVSSAYSRDYCLLWEANVHLDGRGAKLKIKDGNIGVGAKAIDIIRMEQDNNAVFENIFFDGNASGQANTTYDQEGKSTAIHIYGDIGATTSNVTIRNCDFYSFFGNPINMKSGTVTDWTTLFNNIYVEGIRCIGYGEGIQFLNANNLVLSDIYTDPTTVCLGDHIELVRCENFVIENFVVVGGSGAGSGVDLFGARKGFVRNGKITNVSNGIEVHEDQYGNDTEDVVFSDIIIKEQLVPGANGFAFTNENEGTRDITLNNVQVSGFNVGIAVSDVADTIPGPITLNNCQAYNNVTGIIISAALNIVVNGGNYSDNSGNGIAILMTQAPATYPASGGRINIVGANAIDNGAYGLFADLSSKDISLQGNITINARGNYGVLSNYIGAQIGFNKGNIPSYLSFKNDNDAPYVPTVTATSQAHGGTGNLMYKKGGNIQYIVQGTYLTKVRIIADSIATNILHGTSGVDHIRLRDSINLNLNPTEWVELEFDNVNKFWQETDRSGPQQIKIYSRKNYTPSTKTDEVILIDASTSTNNITFDPSPKKGDKYILKVVNNTNAIVINGNGKNIDGYGTVMTLTSNTSLYNSYTFVYDGTKWHIVSDVGKNESTTVTDGTTIDFTKTGDNITAEVKDGSITPAKLDRSYYNTSLTLSGTNLQLTDGGGTITRDLSPILTPSYWSRTGTYTYMTNTGDLAGIGLTSPTHKTHIRSNGNQFKIDWSTGFNASIIDVNNGATTISKMTGGQLAKTIGNYAPEIEIGEFNDVLIEAEKRYGVTYSLGGSHPLLYQNNIDGNSWSISSGTIDTVTIDFTSKGAYNSNGLVYTQGLIYVYYYSTTNTDNITARWMNRNGVWSSNLSKTNYNVSNNNSAYKYTVFTVGASNYMTKLQIALAPSGANAWVSGIRFIPGAEKTEGSYIKNYGSTANTYNSLYFRDDSYVTKILLNRAGSSFFNSGSVGIGNTSPTATLDITGDLKVSSRSGAPNRLAAWTISGNAIEATFGTGFAWSGTNLTFTETYQGTVTNIATNNGITGGTITTSGTIGLTGQALALHNLASNGIISRTGSGAVAARTITAGTGINVSNGDGVSGNPTITNTLPENTSVTDGTTIDFTETGDNITAEVKDGSITPAKLDRSYVTSNIYTADGSIPAATFREITLGAGADIFFTNAGGNLNFQISDNQLAAQIADGIGNYSAFEMTTTYGRIGFDTDNYINFNENGATLSLNGSTGTSGYVLKSGGAGTMYWDALTGAGTVTSIATNNGITGGTITTSGTIGLTGQALALHNLASNGIISRTGSGAVAARTITAGTGISISNGDGVSGNPTITNTGDTNAADDMLLFNGASSADYNTLTTNGVYRATGATNGPSGASHSTMFTAMQSGNYGWQLAGIGNDAFYMRWENGGSWGSWSQLASRSWASANFLTSEVDGSTSNELQSISTSGAAGNITLSNGGGTLNLNVNDADASTTNELITSFTTSGNNITVVDAGGSRGVTVPNLATSNLTQTGPTRVYNIAASGSLNFSSSTGDAQIGIGNAGGEYITADVSSGAHYSTLEMRPTYAQFGYDGNNIIYADDNGVKIQLNGSYGTSGNSLISGGSGSTMTWGKPAIQQVDNYTSSNTWTKPTGCKTVTVIVIGGGGGGGSGSYIDNSTYNSGSGGGGGGAGGRSEVTLDCSSITSTVTITVGSGGSGAGGNSTLPSNGSTGTNGGQSSFGSYVKANGGSGGQGGQLSATSSGGAAGLGASCDGGTGGGSTNTASAGTTGTAARYASGGGNGGAGVTTSSGGGNSTSTPPALGTTGSVTLLGSGGTGGAAANSGGSGGSYGGGGGGGGAGRSATHIQGGAGGSGAGGYVQVITHF